MIMDGGRRIAAEDGGLLMLGQPVAPIPLSRKDVEALIPLLQTWVRTGRLPREEPAAGGYSIVSGDLAWGPFDRREAAFLIDPGEESAEMWKDARVIALWVRGRWELVSKGL